MLFDHDRTGHLDELVEVYKSPVNNFGQGERRKEIGEEDGGELSSVGGNSWRLRIKKSRVRVFVANGLVFISNGNFHITPPL